MAKKSKPSVNVESKASVEQATMASVKEETQFIPSGEGGIIDFYYFFNGLGILIGIIFIIVGILRYGFHTL